MTFADRLEKLRKAATETPWKVSDFAIKSAGDEGNTYFICFLANNADAILELVRAAELAQQWMGVAQVEIDGEWGSGRTLKELETQGELSNELMALRAALSKLNGEQT